LIRARKTKRRVAVQEASQLLTQANALRDQAFADLIFAKTAVLNGKMNAAAAAISRAKLFAERSHDRGTGNRG